MPRTPTLQHSLISHSLPLRRCHGLLILLLLSITPTITFARSSNQSITLNELLGLPSPPSATVTPEITQPIPELTQLTGNNIIEALVTELAQATTRLKQKDSGLNTQRLQQKIIDRFDQILSQANKKSSNNKSNSSSGASQGQSSSSGQGKAPGQGSSSGSRNAPGQGEGESHGSGNTPGQGGRSSRAPQSKQAQPPSSTNGDQAKGGPLRTVDNPNSTQEDQQKTDPLEQQFSEWGHLPARLRQQLIQGLRDPVAPSYQWLTERYYRHLAEEEQP